jgi:pilus assembly protein CpaF
MVGMAGLPMTIGAIRSQIASAIRLVVQLQRLSDGKRRVTGIAEITGMEGDVVQLHDVFTFVREGVDPSGAVIGSFRATGIRPKFLADLKAAGIDVPAGAFDPGAVL